MIGLLGHLTAVYRHYVSYADLLKIRYSPFQCLIMVGTEDRLVREVNSYMLQRVRLLLLSHFIDIVVLYVCVGSWMSSDQTG